MTTLWNKHFPLVPTLMFKNLVPKPQPYPHYTHQMRRGLIESSCSPYLANLLMANLCYWDSISDFCKSLLLEIMSFLLHYPAPQSKGKQVIFFLWNASSVHQCWQVTVDWNSWPHFSRDLGQKAGQLTLCFLGQAKGACSLFLSDSKARVGFCVCAAGVLDCLGRDYGSKATVLQTQFSAADKTVV